MDSDPHSAPHGDESHVSHKNEAHDTPVAEPSATTASTAAANPARNRHIFLSSIVALLMLAIGASLYTLTTLQPTSNDAVLSSTPVKPRQKTVKLNNSSVLQSINKVLESTVVTQPVEVGNAPDGTGRLPSTSESDPGVIVYAIPRYKLDNYPYLTDPVKGYGNAVSTQSRADGDKTYATLLAQLTKERGMVEVAGTAVANDTERSGTYANKQTVCNIKETYDQSGITYVGVACGEISSYREAADMIKPFDAAYFSVQTPEKQKDLQQHPIYYGIPEVKSGIDGYKSASLATGERYEWIRLFYRTPTGNWTYLRSIADQINCDDMATPDQQKAFAGYVCINDDNEFADVPRGKNAQLFVAEAKKLLKLPQIALKKSDGTTGTDMDGGFVYALPSHKLQKYDYETNPLVGYGFGVKSASQPGSHNMTNSHGQSIGGGNNTSAATKDYDAANKLLASKGMTVVADSSFVSPTQSLTTYTGKDTLCVVRVTYNVNKTDRVSVACADITSYEEAARQIKPFYDAYVAANAPATSNYGVPVFKDGIEGYKRAEVSVDSGKALFYQAPKSDKWNYVTTIVDQIQCSDIQASELQKAFAGYVCVNANGDFVSVPRAKKAQTIVNSAKKVFKLPQITTRKADNTTTPVVIGSTTYFVPHFKLFNYSFATGPTVPYGVAVVGKSTNKQSADADYTAGVALLRSKGMNEVKGWTTNTKTFRSATYADKEAVCSTSVQYGVLGQNYVDMGCGDITSFEEEAVSVKPFYDAYTAVQSKQAQSVLYYGHPVVEKGKSDYKRATVTVGVGTLQKTLLFYQAPKGNWKYVTNIVDQISCSVLNTTQLKLAFAGWTCVSTQGKFVTL